MVWKFVILAASCLLAVSSRKVDRQTDQCIDDCEKNPLDISLIVDASASIWPQNFTIGLWFLQEFVDQFKIGPDHVQVSMVTYGDRVYTEDAFGFDRYTDKESLKRAIGAMKYPSGRATETGLAIRYFLQKVEPTTRANTRHVVIVLTDGNSQKQALTKSEARKVLEKGLEVFAIGVGNQVSPSELHNIASDGEHVFIVSDYTALQDIKKRLTYETCGARPENTCGFSPVDLSFVIDSSASISDENFPLELEFIREFLDVFEINPSSTRVSAVMFGDRVYSESAIQFDQFTNKKDTLDAIVSLPWMRGHKTETGAGIKYMINNFAPKSREHGAHIGIIITDGRSQDWRLTARAARDARRHGITTVAVGVGRFGPNGNLDRAELESIAGHPSRVVTTDNFSQLNAIREKLIGITCHEAQGEIAHYSGRMHRRS